MTVLITGAKRGIGLALAKQAAARGNAVIGTYRSFPGQERGIDWQALEVSDQASQRTLADRLGGQPLSLLVCNAGIYKDGGQTLESGFAPQLWDETFAVNVKGVFLTVQTFLPNVRAGKGKIAIISSQMASDTRAPGGSYIYRASKAAALNLGRNLSADLKKEGIPVGIYHPGWVRTDMGGKHADIDVADAADGLLARFNALTLANTGCFETWDGRTHPY